MSEAVRKVQQGDVEWKTLPGGLRFKFLGVGAKFITAIGVAEPGGGETWHKHGPEFEETYYVLKGKGKLCWIEHGEEHTVEFQEGDCLYLDFGVENMFVNTGKEELWMLFSISNVAVMRVE